MADRKYLPTLSELVDRLTITQLKEVFLPEHKKGYAEEINDIKHDVPIAARDVAPTDANDAKITALGTDQKAPFNGILMTEDAFGDLIRAVTVLSQMNLHIWHNESEVRKGTGDGDLALTHGLNGIRNVAKNKIQELIGGRKDFKIDCLAAEFEDWQVSWDGPDSVQNQESPDKKKHRSSEK